MTTTLDDGLTDLWTKSATHSVGKRKHPTRGGRARDIELASPSNVALVDRLFRDAFSATAGLIDVELGIAVRHYDRANPKRCNGEIYPTATSRAWEAVLDCGVEFPGKYNPKTPMELSKNTTTGQHIPPKSRMIIHPADCLRLLITQPEKDHVEAYKKEFDKSHYYPQPGTTSASPARSTYKDPNAHWLIALSALSANGHASSGPPESRELILYASLFSALLMILRQHRKTVDLALQDVPEWQNKILCGMHLAIGRSAWLFSKDPKSIHPYLAYHIAKLLANSRALVSALDDGDYGTSKEYSKMVDDHWTHLSEYFELQVTKHMARRQVSGDPVFDAVSLAFALGGLCRMQPGFQDEALYTQCVSTVIAAQMESGCWPDGVAFASKPTGEIITIPSAEVALCLIDTVFSRQMLTWCDERSHKSLCRVAPALLKYCEYLSATYLPSRVSESPAPRSGLEVSGWSSDRTKMIGIVETWITSASLRFLSSTSLLLRAIRRNIVLRRYGAAVPSQEEDRWDSIIDPDSIIHPISKIKDSVLAALESQLKGGGGPFIQPEKGATSFLLYGPPGSGKTYIVEQIALHLKWPLVYLSPGNFISEGANAFERAARSIFEDLYALDNAVVFFDEGDELFFNRKPRGTSAVRGPITRNSLTFATAAMLPKLAKLNKSRRILFVAATNYMSHIDDAIRRKGRFDHLFLIDRPHADARKQIISEGLKQGSGPRKSKSELANLVMSSAGLATTDLLEAFGKNCANKLPAADVLEGLKKDYIEWCQDDGVRELDSGQVDSNSQEQFQKEWVKAGANMHNRDRKRKAAAKPRRASAKK